MMSWTCCPFPSARAIRTPLKAPGIEPRQSHLTSPRCTVPRRRCTKEPTGFITALATRSDETAASGGTPKKRTSTGVMSAPPPMPVKPTTMPTPNAASESNGSRWMVPPDQENLQKSQRGANPRLGSLARNLHRDRWKRRDFPAAAPKSQQPLQNLGDCAKDPHELPIEHQQRKRARQDRRARMGILLRCR